MDLLITFIGPLTAIMRYTDADLVGDQDTRLLTSGFVLT